MDSLELAFLPARRLHAAYCTGQLSPVDVIECIGKRVHTLNPTLNVFCALMLDSAMEAARASQERYRTRAHIGPLDGIPVSIKDHAHVRGVPTTLGSMLRKDFVPDWDSPVVARLRAAGTLIFAKTNMPEFGWKGVTDNALFGTTRSPWRLDVTPGGSTGGAAAVAAGIGPITLGADGAGSIRIPAAFCGIFGLKPSFGRIPQAPRGGTESLSHDGPLARTVEDAADMLDVMSGPDDLDRNSLPEPGYSFAQRIEHAEDDLRRRSAVVAWSPDLGFAKVDPEVRELTERAARAFEDLGCHVEEVDPGWDDPFAILEPLYLGAMGGALRHHYRDPDSRMDPYLVQLLKEGESLSAYDYGAAVIARVEFYERVRRLMDGYDLLLTPSTATPPFQLDRVAPDLVGGEAPEHFFSWTPFTYPFNLTGQPAASVPAGFTSEGLPVGLQIVGRRHADLSVLQAAKAFERARPWSAHRPPVA